MSRDLSERQTNLVYSANNDYAVIDKLQDGRFKFRKRAVGDVNGILLYAFRKRHIN